MVHIEDWHRVTRSREELLAVFFSAQNHTNLLKRNYSYEKIKIDVRFFFLLFFINFDAHLPCHSCMINAYIGRWRLVISYVIFFPYLQFPRISHGFHGGDFQEYIKREERKFLNLFSSTPLVPSENYPVTLLFHCIFLILSTSSHFFFTSVSLSHLQH